MARNMQENSSVYRGYVKVRYAVVPNSYNPTSLREEETWVGPYLSAGLAKTQVTRFKKQRERWAEPGSLMVLEEYVEVNDGWARV